MIRFSSDYSEGAHPQILQALINTNMAQTGGYSEDPFCDEAKELIQKALGATPAKVSSSLSGRGLPQASSGRSLRTDRPYQCS